MDTYNNPPDKQTLAERAAEDLLVDIHNIGCKHEPDSIDISVELKDFSDESLTILKSKLSLLTRLVNKEFTRRHR